MNKLVLDVTLTFGQSPFMLAILPVPWSEVQQALRREEEVQWLREPTRFSFTKEVYLGTSSGLVGGERDAEEASLEMVGPSLRWFKWSLVPGGNSSGPVEILIAEWSLLHREAMTLSVMPSSRNLNEAEAVGYLNKGTTQTRVSVELGEHTEVPLVPQGVLVTKEVLSAMKGDQDSFLQLWEVSLLNLAGETTRGGKSPGASLKRNFLLMQRVDGLAFKRSVEWLIAWLVVLYPPMALSLFIYWLFGEQRD